MPKILLITSHYPPSNLTATHRVRLFAKHLPLFGWDPIVLTVEEKFYEEKPDFDLIKLIPDTQRIERVNAFKITNPRMVGDIGLRAFFQLKKKAFAIIATEKIDFVYIFIPSFYLSLLGPLIHRKYGIKYGIDYIDPWVHFFPGSEKVFSRHWFSTKISKILEPFTVNAASLISSVSASYIGPIFDRNPKIQKKVKTLSFPYGWDPDEGFICSTYNSGKSLIENKKKLKLIYTGAFLPQSEQILREWLKCIANNIILFHDVEIHFIGTGVSQSSPKRRSISQIAAEFNLLGSIIFEPPSRISYFDVLYHHSIADGVFILGSAETHYTPSKIFNAFIAEKPIFAILHPSSSAIDIIDETKWGVTCLYLDYKVKEFSDQALLQFEAWKLKTLSHSWEFNKQEASKYSAKHLTENLATTLNDLV